MVLELPAAQPRGRRLRVPLQGLALQHRLAQPLVARQEQAQACRQPVLPHLRQQLRPVRKPHPHRAAQRRQHRTQLKQVGRLQVLEAASAKRGLRQAEGREVQRTPDRAPRPNDLSPRDRANLKATLARASRVPTLNNLAPNNQRRARRLLERVIARNQANARPVVHPSNLNKNSKESEFSSRPAALKAAGLFFYRAYFGIT